MSLDAGGDGLGRRRHHHFSSLSAPFVLCYLVLIPVSNPVSPPVTIGYSKSSVCLKATVSFAASSPFHHNLSRCATSRVQTFATASARPCRRRSHLISRLRRKQNHMKPLLSVMLSLWLFVLCSAAPVSFPAMAVNCFSGESPDEIYSEAYRQPVWARFAFVPLWRCLLTSSSDLSASVKPPGVTACFSCSRSFQCTDLKSHRLLPSSSALCPMNSFPKLSRPILAAVRNNESLLSLSFIDFIDQGLDFGSGKFLWLQHGNVGSESICLDSLLASSESIEKLILMSVDGKVKRSVLPNLYHSYLHYIVLGAHHTCFMSSCFILSTSVRPACVCGSQHLTWRPKLKHPQMINSEAHMYLLGAIFGTIPNVSSVTHYQSPTPTRSSNTSILSLCWNLSKLEDCSPLAFSTPRKASQTSSCQGHERTFSTVTTSTKVSFHEMDPCLGCIASDHCRFPCRLIPYVMVRLGPEGTTILTPVRIEVVERPTSRYTVTIPIEEFEGWCTLSRDFIARGTFHDSSNLLSSLFKLVSLSLYCLVLNVFIRIAHQVFDVAFIFVTG